MKVLPVNQNRKRKRKKTGLVFVAIAVMVLFGIIAYGKVSLVEEKNAKEALYSELLEKYQTEVERTGLLEERRAYMQTVRYIEEIAREKLGLVYKDEIIFRPMENEEE